jgi:hypothetical protein
MTRAARIDLVFRFGQCDKENHGWREIPQLTVPCESFDLLAGPSPSGKDSFNRKTNSFVRLTESPLLRTLAGNYRPLGNYSQAV